MTALQAASEIASARQGPAARHAARSRTRPAASRSSGSWLIWAALLAIFFVPVLADALEAAWHFSGPPIDGAFQLYNALRRIAAGFRPGVDFQVFHGVGVPYVHYWLFRALGGQFPDSELARQVVSAVVFPLSSLLLYRAFARTWTRALCLTAVTVAVAEAFKFAALLQAANSMIGLRSSLPILAPVVLYLATSRRLRVIGGGAMIGAALFVSTEQGLALLAAFIVVSAIVVARSGDRLSEVVDAILALLVAVVFLVGSLVAVGGISGAVSALRYNFRLVPMDQYWFFGVPPNPFVPSWGALPGMAAHIPPIGLGLIFGVVAVVVYVARLLRHGTASLGARDRAFALLAIYGLLSCTSLLGVFIPAYSLPCWRVLISLVLLELLAWADRRAPLASTGSWLGLPRPMGAIALVLAALTIIARPTLIGEWLVRVPRAVSHVVHGPPFSIGGVWPETLKIDTAVVARVEAENHTTHPVIWSTYAGWMEARAGVFHPSFDYIIHALGPENRQRYVEDFRRSRPQLVQTIDPQYTPYEPWIENASWDFYRALLTSYVVTARTPWSFLWEPRADTGLVQQVVASLDVPGNASAVKLPSAPPVGGLPVTLLEVQVDYEARNPLRRLPVVGALPRYLVGLEGAVSQAPVSLDPYTTSMRFPLVVVPGQSPVLHFQPFSLLPGARLVVHRVRVSTIALDPRNAVWMQALTTRLRP